MTSENSDAVVTPDNAGVVRDSVDGGLARFIAGNPVSEDMTAEQAQSAYQAFRADPDAIKALSDKRHPTHQLAAEHRMKLFARMYPESAPLESAETPSSEGDTPDDAKSDEPEGPGVWDVPDDAKDYRIPHGGQDHDVNLEREVRQMFADGGLPQHLAANFTTIHNDMQAKQLSEDAKNTLAQSVTAALQKEWGDDFESNMAAINGALELVHAPRERILEIIGSGVGLDTYFWKQMLELARRKGAHG